MLSFADENPVEIGWRDLVHHECCRSRSGFAVISVLLALALLTTIGIALTSVGTVEVRSSHNHRSATQALLLADAGATHALALMRGPLSDYTYSDVLLGSDGVPSTADDGVLSGFGLSPSDAVPDTGVLLGDGRYFVRVQNDAADTSAVPTNDSNYRLTLLCRGETDDGGVAEVGMALGALAYPALVTGGDLVLVGSPDVLGPCAGIHVNGTLQVSGNPTVDGEVTVSGTTSGAGTIHDALGNPVVPEYGMPPVEIPEHNPLDYCAAANYVLHDGWVVTVGPPRDSSYAVTSGVLGWQFSLAQNQWTLTGNQAVPGTVCVYGNVQITGSLGSNANPMAMTILATGSVHIGGNPRMESSHPDGILIVAGGDLKVSGNAAGSTPAYSGLLYGGAQCQFNGTPDIYGHVLCRDDPNPPGSVDLVTQSKVNGNPRVIYDCSGERRRTVRTSWWESRA